MRRTRLAVAAVVGALALVAGSSHPAGAEPTSTGGVHLAPFAGNRHASLAATPAGWVMAVWEQKVGPQYDLVGALISSDTSQVHRTFTIATGPRNQINPDVTSQGTTWIVAWEEVTTSANHDILAQRLDHDGDRLGPVLEVSTTPAKQVAPAVAADRNGPALVVWHDTRNAAATRGDVYGRRVQSNGVLLDGAAGLRLSTDTASDPWADREPDVAWNGTTFLVTSVRTNGAIHALVLDQRRRNGTRLAGPFAIPTSARQGSPAIASDGRDFMIASELGDRVATMFVDGTDIFRIAIRWGTPGTAADPAIAFEGVYLTAWVDGRDGSPDIWGARLAPDGAPLDPSGFLITEHHPVNAAPALAGSHERGPRRFVVAWDATPAGGRSGVIAYGLHFPTDQER